MTGYCSDCGNQACICPVPVPADHHPTGDERLALCRLGRPHEFGSTGWCVCGEPAAPAVPVRELIAEVIADRDRLAARVAALEAAGRALATLAREAATWHSPRTIQNGPFKKPGDPSTITVCAVQWCIGWPCEVARQTTFAIDAWDRAVSAGGREDGQG